MTIISGATDSFKDELLRAIHNFASDTFMIALYQDGADIGPNTETYTVSNEVSGTGYVAGGKALTVSSLSSSQGVSWASFSDISWTGASFTARGALIYNASQANRSMMILDFGAPRVFTSASNTITFPNPTRDTAIFRIGFSR